MSDTYKVRMTVLAMVAAHDPVEAEATAAEIVTDAGLTVLQVEEPDKAVNQFISGSVEGDIYP